MSDGENEIKDEKSQRHTGSFQEMGNSIFKASLCPIASSVLLSTKGTPARRTKAGKSVAFPPPKKTRCFVIFFLCNCKISVLFMKFRFFFYVNFILELEI